MKILFYALVANINWNEIYLILKGNIFVLIFTQNLNLSCKKMTLLNS